MKRPSYTLLKRMTCSLHKQVNFTSRSLSKHVLKLFDYAILASNKYAGFQEKEHAVGAQLHTTQMLYFLTETHRLLQKLVEV